VDQSEKLTLPHIQVLKTLLSVCVAWKFIAVRSALFWVVMQQVVVPYRRFGTTYLTLEERTDRLSSNVGKGLPLHAAKPPRGAQVSSTWQWKPEITHSLMLSQSPSTYPCPGPVWSDPRSPPSFLHDNFKSILPLIFEIYHVFKRFMTHL
jgi:hypothetical protein